MKPKPLASELAFGKIFTDHMLVVDWTRDRGWHDPEITPFENFSVHPGSKVTNYVDTVPIYLLRFNYHSAVLILHFCISNEFVYSIVADPN